MHTSNMHRTDGAPPEPHIATLRSGMTGFQLLAYLHETDALDLLNALRLIPEPRPPIVETVGTLLREKIQAIKEMRALERAAMQSPTLRTPQSPHSQE